MPDFNIDIKTTADTTGAKKTAEDLGKVTAAAKSATPEVAKLTEQTDKATISKQKWSAALHQVSHQIPGLGLAIAALKHPIVLVGALLAAFIGWWQRLRQEWRNVEDSAGR